ncbi:MAG TPA: NnrS family protein [Steroidobacteraceae bacterium]|nr:NnrS family protein [Steroidobacteraceae bacterium]
MTIPSNTPTAVRPSANRCALFDYGFRPFFLLSGLYALLIVPLWLYRFAHASTPFGSLPALYWHSHEMVYGFVMAAVAGFLLTAVPSWTGVRGFAGRPLFIAVCLWALGRVAMSAVGAIPFWMTAAAELVLLPVLLALLAPPIFRNANRNAPLLAVLAVLWLIDGAFLFALQRGDAVLAGSAMRLAIDFVLILVTVIGGRIVPAFTANALRQRGEEVSIITRRPVEVAVIAAMVAIAVVDAFAPLSTLSGVLALLAAAAHAIRLSGWRSFRTGGEPILWVMHLAYAWLPVGLALKAAALLADADWAAKWQHALTMGVFATMILAVMSRASLGHTGRPITVPRVIAVAYVLLTVSTVLRVFGTTLFPGHYLLSVSVAGLAWVLCFGIFVAVYAPILWSPRADGKPG